MIHRPLPAVLDANVLVPSVLCNLLLRTAASHMLFLPKWSEHILDEVKRTQLSLPSPFSAAAAEKWRNAALEVFPEAITRADLRLEGTLTNDPKDRHVLATAIIAKAPMIVTVNTRHFRPEDLRDWQVEAVHPDDFMTNLYSMMPQKITMTIKDMSRKESVDQTITRLSKHVPVLAAKLAEDLL